MVLLKKGYSVLTDASQPKSIFSKRNVEQCLSVAVSLIRCQIVQL